MQVDWYKLFAPSQPILETVVRGTFTYLCLFALLRVLRRQTGSLGPADLLVLLLIADASQNAMAGEYRAITDGLILVATIMGWEYAIDYLSFHVPALGKWIDRQPLKIIENGRVDQRALGRELMSDDELASQLRQKGIASAAQVKLGYIEGDGHVSAITDEQAQQAEGAAEQAGVNG